MLESYSPAKFLEKGRKPVFGKCRIEKSIMNILAERGVSRLYRHQAEGIRKIRKGKNIVIVAPTASGKSEIFLVPIVEAALEGEHSLVIYPTKALSRDQLARFREFAILGVRSEIYDGDTPKHRREKIRADLPQILITNFDMLHFMLLNNRIFGDFWRKLRFVVIDELHYYSGVLGAHVANILRRLKRIAKKKGNEKMQFICCSATVANARTFAEELVCEKFSEIDAKYAPKGEILHFLISPKESYTTASIKIAREIGKKCLIFGNSHSVVERLGIIAREMGYNLRVYRAGLSYEERRRIEEEFKLGRIDALATTSALELGMDIGCVDAVILAGFPGTLTRVRQRLGRAGRKGQRALGIFIACENPLDIYYLEHPKKYLYGEPESCYVNAQNENILRSHLLSLSKDYPLAEEELSAYEKKLIEELKEKGLAKEWAGHIIPTREGVKFVRTLSIRGTGENVRIYDLEKREFIGEREEYMALRELHEGAIYLHGGEKYRCEKLDLEEKIAFVRRIRYERNEYTSALYEKNAEVLEVLKKRKVFGRKLFFGKVHIRDEIYGYVVKDYFKNITVGKHLFPEPLEYEFDTYAIWLDYPFRAIPNFAEGLHAVEHVSIAMMPALTGADPKELGGISYPTGRMYVYDGVPEGNGVTKIVFQKFEIVQKMAFERLRKCRCAKGCPSCILNPQCGNNNNYLDKEAAKEILRAFIR